MKISSRWNQVLVLMLLPLMLSCGASESGENASSSSDLKPDEANVFIPELWPKRETSPARDERIEARVKSILDQMSVEEKVGQVIQAELKNVTPEDVRKYHLGSVLNGGGTTPNNDKYASVDDWANLAEAFYQASMDTSDGGVAIPLIWGSDAVHGNNNLYGATIFPHNIGLGAANDPDLIRRIGKATALEVAVTGVNWTFGPTVAVARDIRWGRTYESYSERPEIVSRYAQAMVMGIQGENKAGDFNPDGLIATAKHFLGDGGTRDGIDRGDTQISEKELFEVHAAGYLTALDSGVLTTMASFNSWNGERLHGHKYLLTDILKGRLGFDGFVVSDWNGHRHIPGCTLSRCPQAINAGLDMLMVTEEWKAFYENLLADVRSGALPMPRLDDAVTRILRVKLHAGLFEAGPVLQRKNVGDQWLVGSDDHREIAREAVRKSLVLLKNEGALLPLSPSSNILVVGDADNIGKQAGGWTLSWQGTGNSNDDFPGASSIYDGILSAAKAAGGAVHLSSDGNWEQDSFPQGAAPDAAIVVYGEEPYAEWHGDIAHIEYQQGSKTDLAMLQSLRSRGIPIVSVFLSGRPLWVNKELNMSDAFVAAWLPGSEGQGVADVLLSKADAEVNFDFQGRLSFSWPQYVTQTGAGATQDDNAPLFEYGYGLSYESVGDEEAGILGKLNEDGIDPMNDELAESWVFVSRELAPWSFRIRDQGSEAVTVIGNHQTSGEDSNLVFQSVDRSTQEDARRIRLKGLRAAEVSLSTAIKQDFSEYLEAGSFLNFLLKVDQYPSEPVDLSLACEEGCSGTVSLNELIQNQRLSTWNTLFVDLRCFAQESKDLQELSGIFVLRSQGVLDISIADIKVTPDRTWGESVDKTIVCD